jgi:hypothetical protein
MQTLIAVISGLVLASALISFARRSGNYAREKRIYGTGLVVAALVYVGFGFFSDSNGWKIIELIGVPVYALFAWLGLKKSGWFLALGWALHVFWDASLHGAWTLFVPSWYVGLCLGFDVLVAGYVAVRELKN